MSRIIVKNLPDNTKTEKVKATFGEFGNITDIQLKYTRDGKFRKFGFIGFEKEDEAHSAIKSLNNTYFGLSKIQVEICSELGDANKPKAWSKYAPDSTAFKKLHEIKNEGKACPSKEEKKSNKLGKFDPELVEIIKKHKDDAEFLEYMELHGKGDKVSQILADLEESLSDQEEEKDKDDGNQDEEVEETKTESAAHSAISDLEYLKLKMKGVNQDEVAKIKKDSEKKCKEVEKKHFFTIKIRNLPYKTRKKDIKEIFSPVVPASVRLAANIKGIAFVGFKTDKDMRKALIKHKTFYNGKQLFMTEHKEKSSTESKPEKWKRQEESLKNEECIAESGRIFVRNLAYSVTEEQLETLFSKYGPISEVILPVDKTLRQIRGYGVVTFLIPEHAVAAYTQLDGSVFHGRMLHLLPAKAKEVPGENDGEGEGEGGSYKVKKLKKLKASSSSGHNWNSLFVDMNAVAELVASKFDVSKEEVLTGSNAAVRLALGETQIVSETRKFLEDNGVDLDAFNQQVKSRSKTIILVKNLPASTQPAEIRKLFSTFGLLSRVVLPPTGITAVVEFVEPSEARAAFMKLAYTKFKYVPLYLEWAPHNTFKTSKLEENADEKDDNEEDKENKDETKETVGKNEDDGERSDDEEEAREPEANTTLFVKNISFSSTDEDLRKHFSVCGDVASAQVSKKKDLSKPGQFLSMGYGFVQFYLESEALEALKRLQGSLLQGHALEIKRSNRTVSNPDVNTRKKTNVQNQTGKKIIVRNIPFQATTREITDLFKAFGELNFVRLPSKLVGTGTHRGFGFVEFVTNKSAKKAMKALCQSTHLFGRRLVLEWAKEDEGVEELRKRTAQHFHQDDAGPKKSKKAVADISVGDQEPEEEADLL